MYCKNCGSEIDDKAAFCVHCGVATHEQNVEVKKVNSLGVAGFIVSILSIWLGFFVCIPNLVGIILSANGIKNSKDCSQANGLAVAGLVIGILTMCFWFICWIALGATMCSGVYE